MATTVTSNALVASELRVDLRSASRSRDGKKASSYLECQDLGYEINKTRILEGISTVIPPGRLVALMGPSGAGKTTLLNVLGGRGRGQVRGSITLNGKPITRKLMRKESKLVPQHDYVTPILTARETLMYTAKLALPASADFDQRVDEIIDMLSLGSCADVPCGGPNLKGLSGGQLKRVSIGMELLLDPSILLLDECTSGLDSKVAEDVVDLIKALAQGGRTVICTIHQPSFQVFSKFDWLIMLDKGRVAFSGETGQVSEYLAAINRPCPEFVNPVDHLMQVLSEPLPGADADLDLESGPASEQVKAKNGVIVQPDMGFSDLFDSTRFGMLALEDIDEQRALRDAQVSPSGKSDVSAFYDSDKSPGFFSQIATIFRRALYVTIKDKGQLRTRVAQLVFMGLIVSTIYLRMENTQGRVQDRMSALFILMLFLAMSSVMSTAMALPEERSVFTREIHNGYYNATAYFLARVGVLMLFQVIYAVAFGAVVYYVLGLYPAANHFFIFLTVLALISAIAGVAGFIAGTVFPTPQQATAMVPMIIMPLTIFAGLFVPLANIPTYWVWLYYLSFFQYALQNLMVNEFADQYLEPCDTSGPPGSCPYGACSTNFSDPQPCPGTVVLDQMDYNPDNLNVNFAILVGFLGALLVLGSFTMHRLVRKSR